VTGGNAIIARKKALYFPFERMFCYRHWRAVLPTKLSQNPRRAAATQRQANQHRHIVPANQPTDRHARWL